MSVGLNLFSVLPGRNRRLLMFLARPGLATCDAPYAGRLFRWGKARVVVSDADGVSLHLLGLPYLCRYLDDLRF